MLAAQVVHTPAQQELGKAQIGGLSSSQDGLIALAGEGVRLTFEFHLHLKGVRHRHHLLSGPS